MRPRRLLIATIGENDPVSPYGPMAALRAALHDRPEVVYLVHTAATSRQAEETRHEIERLLAHVRVHLVPLPTDDPTDVETMLHFLHRRWVEVRRDSDIAAAIGRTPRPEDVHVSACGSSGTRQMGLALTLSVDLAFPSAHHWTAVHPRGAGGDALMPSRDPCLRPFRAGLLRHEHECRDGFRLLGSCRFHEAAAKFEDRLGLAPPLPAHESSSPVRVAARLARTFRDLADSDARRALRILFAEPVPSAAAARAGAPVALTAVLCRIEDWFAPIERTIHTPNDLGDPWPAELVAVALRERAAGRLALAVTKLQTAFEVAMQIRMSEITGASCAHNRGTWDRMLDGIRARDAEFDRRLGQPSDRIKAAANLARARNDLVHRGRTQHELDQVMAAGHRFVDDLLGTFGWRSSADAPTRPEDVGALAALLADWAGLPMED